MLAMVPSMLFLMNGSTGLKLLSLRHRNQGKTELTSEVKLWQNRSSRITLDLWF